MNIKFYWFYESYKNFEILEIDTGKFNSENRTYNLLNNNTKIVTRILANFE